MNISDLKFSFICIKVFVSLLILSSCASKSEVVYFQDVSRFETIVNEDTFAPKFKVDDVVSIHISTLNPEASAPFNLFRAPSQSEVARLGGTIQQIDYLVDQQGEIDFPVVGKIKISGLSPEELRISLREKLADYLINPIINIRLQNFSVTILGEVNRPGTYQINGEEITIMEALGLANDITIKGLRKNVLVIRDFNGTKVYHRIDLTTKEAVKSPVYYLTQNDVVIVEPNKSAVTSSSLDNRATIAVSIASVLITSTVLFLTRN